MNNLEIKEALERSYEAYEAIEKWMESAGYAVLHDEEYNFEVVIKSTIKESYYIEDTGMYVGGYGESINPDSDPALQGAKYLTSYDNYTELLEEVFKYLMLKDF